MEDLTGQPAAIPHVTVLQAVHVAAPASITVVTPVAPIPATPPAIVPTPPTAVHNPVIAQAPVDFPAEIGTFTQVPNADLWKEEFFSEKSYWTHPQVPGKYFFWHRTRSCYFVYQGNTRTRMDTNFRLYLISEEEDAAERAANAAARSAKGKGGKGGKGKGGKGGKGAAN